MKAKSFLFLTGASVVGFLVSVLLHNFFYALAVVTEHIAALHYLFEFLHAIFFLVAVFVCPLVFVVGVVGGLVTYFRKKAAP